MKKRISTIILSIVLTLSLVFPAFAVPLQGIYIGDGVMKYYSFQDFINSTTKVQEINTAGLDNVKLYQNGKIASASEILDAGSLADAMMEYLIGSLPGEFTDVNGMPVIPEPQDPGEPSAPVVVSVIATNATTVLVTFDKAVTVAAPNFSIAQHPITGVTPSADEKAATLTVNTAFESGIQHTLVTSNVTADDGGVLESASKTFTYTDPVVPPVSKAAVTSITFKNYRQIQVEFNTVVNLASAADPANYYFEIVDGDAQYGVMQIVPPNLADSNQLSKIGTNYPGGAPAWWADGNITASNIDGRTVVDICLPEDARFTNVVDEALAAGDGDDERTLTVLKGSSDRQHIVKYLTKNTRVNVAVRNVRDAGGDRTIDTAVMPITILDQEAPKLLSVKKVSTGEYCLQCHANDEFDRRDSVNGLGKDLGNFTLTADGSDSLAFEYSEPVFDAHGIDKSSFDNWRDLQLYVDGKLVASLADNNLDDFMAFAMGSNATYDRSRVAVLDVKAAVEAAWGAEWYEKGFTHKIHFVGVTDLAGNIEVASEHWFNVTLEDPAVVNPIAPEVKGIVQVADNVFRIEFNRARAEGNLIIENADGDGGRLWMEIPRSEASGNDKFFSYVFVPAVNSELDALNIDYVTNYGYLSYDRQDFIFRDVKVTDVIAGELRGENYTVSQMKLFNDINAPVVLNPDSIDYAGRGSSIVVPVKDVVPYAFDGNLPHPVKAIKYFYNHETHAFTNLVDEFSPDWSIGCGDFLPVRVSYIDADGATHTALVSNRQLEENNPGADGSITFNYDTFSPELTLNLADYAQLLDSSGQLVPGVEYKIEFPKGYFSDSPRETWFNLPTQEINVQFARHDDDDDYRFRDILYVDDARTGEDFNCWDWWWGTAIGYTSREQAVNVSVAPKPIVVDDAVPQTSKELIRFDIPKNELWVEFTGKIDVNTLKDPNNYTLNGKTLAQWGFTSDDIRYELINLPDQDVHQYAAFKIPAESVKEDGDVAFSVEGVANPDGGKMTKVETVVELIDNTRPVLVDAKVTGQRQIQLTFDEPLEYLVDPEVSADKQSAAKNFKVVAGDQNITVLEAVLPIGFNTDRQVVLNLGTDIPDNGAITVQIVEDQNGNILIQDLSLNNNPINKDITPYPVTR
ncbi:MAG: hypothetical protein ACYC21_09440 [Eubacteriales bacterium]